MRPLEQENLNNLSLDVRHNYIRKGMQFHSTGSCIGSICSLEDECQSCNIQHLSSSVIWTAQIHKADMMAFYLVTCGSKSLFNPNMHLLLWQLGRLVEDCEKSWSKPLVWETSCLSAGPSLDLNDQDLLGWSISEDKAEGQWRGRIGRFKCEERSQLDFKEWIKL